MPFEDNSFDLIYTISTFEHINGIGETLSEIKRVLKPGGKFFTDFCPIWTSIAGHHVYCHGPAMRQGYDRDEQVLNAIPPWAHLYMSEDEMEFYLSKTELNEDRIKAIIEFIFHGQDINRMSAFELRNNIFNSGMIVREYNEYVTFSRQWALDKKGSSELTAEIIKRLRKTQYSLDEIGIVHMVCELEKYKDLKINGL